MLGSKKNLSDIYTIQKFYNTFQMYLKILTGITLLILLFMGIIKGSVGIFSKMLNPVLIVCIILIGVSIIVFIPYVFSILIKEQMNKWIVAFFIMVIIPFILVYLLFQDEVFTSLAILVPIILYNLYCYFVKSEVEKWLNEYNWQQTRLDHQKEKEEREDNLYKF